MASPFPFTLFSSTAIVTAVVSQNFVTTTTLPAWLSHSRAGNAMMYDSTGKLTYAPNNLIQRSNDTSTGWNANGGAFTTTTGTLPDGSTGTINIWTSTVSTGGFPRNET